MNLYQKLVEIRKDVINFSKDTEGYGYKYVSGSQAIAKTQYQALMIMLTLKEKNVLTI